MMMNLRLTLKARNSRSLIVPSRYLCRSVLIRVKSQLWLVSIIYYVSGLARTPLRLVATSRGVRAFFFKISMYYKQQREIDKATKALLGLGEVPHSDAPQHTKKHLDRRFKLNVDRKGRGKVEEVTE